MPTITPITPSGSTNGKGIKIVATSSAGTTIHTATSTSGEFDDITLFAYNSDTVDRELTVLFGGTTTPDNEIKITVPSKAGLFAVVAGLRLGGAASLVVSAYCAAAANVITVTAVVNRYAP